MDTPTQKTGYPLREFISIVILKNGYTFQYGTTTLLQILQRNGVDAKVVSR